MIRYSTIASSNSRVTPAHYRACDDSLPDQSIGCSQAFVARSAYTEMTMRHLSIWKRCNQSRKHSQRCSVSVLLNSSCNWIGVNSSINHRLFLSMNNKVIIIEAAPGCWGCVLNWQCAVVNNQCDNTTDLVTVRLLETITLGCFTNQSCLFKNAVLGINNSAGTLTLRLNFSYRIHHICLDWLLITNQHLMLQCHIGPTVNNNWRICFKKWNSPHLPRLAVNNKPTRTYRSSVFVSSIAFHRQVVFVSSSGIHRTSLDSLLTTNHHRRSRRNVTVVQCRSSSWYLNTYWTNIIYLYSTIYRDTIETSTWWSGGII